MQKSLLDIPTGSFLAKTGDECRKNKPQRRLIDIVIYICGTPTKKEKYGHKKNRIEFDGDRRATQEETGKYPTVKSEGHPYCGNHQ